MSARRNGKWVASASRTLNKLCIWKTTHYEEKRVSHLSLGLRSIPFVQHPEMGKHSVCNPLRAKSLVAHTVHNIERQPRRILVAHLVQTFDDGWPVGSFRGPTK